MRKGILVSLVVVCMCGCGVTKPTIEHTTTTKLEIRERLVFVRDSAKFTIPEIREVNRTRDTSSHLENDYAKSDARIEDGLLYHDLESKPQTLYIPFEVPVPVHDTTYLESNEEIISQSVEVEKKLTLWQKIRLNGFWVLLIFVAWYNRNVLINLAKKVIK